jgi:signal transduction histidine kinase
MKIKQFIKPNSKKINVLLILFIILFILSIIFWNVADIHFNKSIELLGNILTGIFILPAYVFPWQSNLNIILLFAIYLFFEILYLYLLSCFIVWIFDKVKKKK